jgi:hypothetical protein
MCLCVCVCVCVCVRVCVCAQTQAIIPVLVLEGLTALSFLGMPRDAGMQVCGCVGVWVCGCVYRNTHKHPCLHADTCMLAYILAYIHGFSSRVVR